MSNFFIFMIIMNFSRCVLLCSMCYRQSWNSLYQLTPWLLDSMFDINILCLLIVLCNFVFIHWAHSDFSLPSSLFCVCWTVFSEGSTPSIGGTRILPWLRATFSPICLLCSNGTEYNIPNPAVRNWWQARTHTRKWYMCSWMMYLVMLLWLLYSSLDDCIALSVDEQLQLHGALVEGLSFVIQFLKHLLSDDSTSPQHTDSLILLASVRVLGAWLAEESLSLTEEVYTILPPLIRMSEGSTEQGRDLMKFLLPGLSHLVAEDNPRKVLLQAELHSVLLTHFRSLLR